MNHAACVFAALARLSRHEPSDKGYRLEDLAVAAHRRNRTALGLPGYEQEHPDVRKAEAGLSHLIMTGLACCGDSGRYFLTPAGWAQLGEDSGSREHVELVRRLLSSDTFRKFCGGKKSQIDAGSACSFWGKDGPVQVGGAVSKIKVLLGDADGADFGGLWLDHKVLRQIGFCNDYLLDRFSAHCKFKNLLGSMV